MTNTRRFSGTSAPGHQILWDFEAQEFPLPEGAGLGRIQMFAFNDGLQLYRSEFRVQHECIIDSNAGETELGNLLCSILLLTGEVLLETPDGVQHPITPQSGLLFRVQDNGTRIILRGGQTVRHIGVTVNIPTFHHRLGDTLPGDLAAFSSFPETGVVSRKIPVQSRLRSLLANIFSPQTCRPDSLQELALEGISLSILAEMSRIVLTRDSNQEETVSLWGEHIFEDLKTYIRSHLALPLKTDDICKRFGISKRQLGQLFHTLAQCSPKEFLRRERLGHARELIHQKGIPVKAAAHAVGYNHVSNFTKAYRDHFGETPGQTLRLVETGATQ
ncbi:AraC family transcriptional regulator [Marinobacter sp. F3R08]|uniref:AraC family transcriptional regulator n=1 Tax=Marinobacter sp. F3R08 TaxID=2841559 RepID=UPI001C08D2BB|nr:helix-turn-helix domain-containing protein [Marinobacter sp. F3R08]MBU2955002.1 helix-turn-helix domain-containing protein [Marinobacter sp. F3R08]